MCHHEKVVQLGRGGLVVRPSLWTIVIPDGEALSVSRGDVRAVDLAVNSPTAGGSLSSRC